MDQRIRFGFIITMVLMGMMFGVVLPTTARTLTTILPATMTTVSGMVYDGGVEGGQSHGYPLYASLTFSAPGFTHTIYNDPFTGAYQVDLEASKTYQVSVSAVPSGYMITSTQLVVQGGGTQTQDFSVFVDQIACQAPGYSGGAFFEDFEAGVLPNGWVNFDYASTGEVWEFYSDPPFTNETPGEGGFAILDSFKYQGVLGYQDAGLRTPVLDYSAASTVTLAFDTDFIAYEAATAAVRVSGDNGTTWTTRESWTTDVRTTPISLDITSLAAGKSQVMVEFRYTGDPANPWGDWWQVDNVSIQAGDCSLVPGGVVAGYVRDENTGDPLIGADVVSPSLAVKSFALEEDPLNAGLYWAFQPTATDPTSISFTASLENYTSDSHSVPVRQNLLTRQDFLLGTGFLSFTPSSFTFSMLEGEAPVIDTLTITNTGALPVNFGLKTINKPFPNVPAYAIAYPGENLAYIPDTSTPSNWTTIGSVDDPIEERDFIAGDFIGGDFSTLYMMDAFNDTLFALNTTTAAYTEVGLAAAEGEWTGLTGTPDGILYGISTDYSTFTNLYTLDTSTAAVTNLGALLGIKSGNDLAYNPDDGLIYIIDSYTYHLFKVDPSDPSSLVVTDVGPLGMNTKTFQGLDFEEQSGLLYWAANDFTSGQNELRIIDTLTGSSYSLGVFPGDERAPILAFATSGSREWISLNPQGGILQPGNSVNVTLTVDPGVLDHPGVYQAEVVTQHDTIYEYDHIPINLNFDIKAPTITSDNNAAFGVGEPGAFTVETTGYPIPDITIEGVLPAGVEFADKGDGTATLGGTPVTGSGGVYPLTITASNGLDPDAVQAFELTVNEPLMITSPDKTTFFVGVDGSFLIQAMGFPIPKLDYLGELPLGLQFIDKGDGTALISGVPGEGTGGDYPLTIRASNVPGQYHTQAFTLTVTDGFLLFLPLIVH
jgi:hypothetical protein